MRDSWGESGGFYGVKVHFLSGSNSSVVTSLSNFANKCIIKTGFSIFTRNLLINLSNV